jgi:hypothetical protein
MASGRCWWSPQLWRRWMCIVVVLLLRLLVGDGPVLRFITTLHAFTATVVVPSHYHQHHYYRQPRSLQPNDSDCQADASSLLDDCDDWLVIDHSINDHDIVEVDTTDHMTVVTGNNSNTLTSDTNSFNLSDNYIGSVE